MFSYFENRVLGGGRGQCLHISFLSNFTAGRPKAAFLFCFYLVV